MKICKRKSEMEESPSFPLNPNFPVYFLDVHVQLSCHLLMEYCLFYRPFICSNSLISPVCIDYVSFAFLIYQRYLDKWVERMETKTLDDYQAEMTVVG